ncbi:MAG: pseudouridine synthase [Lachnospiraceae bacterium]|nr:pseudouridine synthase [Lachnospiraceae bacterium]
MEQIRLNKYLAEHGICSRREADRLIEQCRVTVNGSIAGMGTKVSDEDEVALNGKRIGGKPKTVVLAFYKPVGVTCTEKDRHAEKIITDMIHYPIRVTYAGRLDKNSEGLLLLTNDGQLIDAMMRGANRHEKEYVVKVDKEITEEFLETMSTGIYLKELERTTRPCQVKAEGKFTFRIILTQGLNRQIRRMCEACGYEVKKLKRVRIMNISLDKIPYGKYRELTESEMEQLYTLAGLKR